MYVISFISTHVLMLDLGIRIQVFNLLIPGGTNSLTPHTCYIESVYGLILIIYI